MLERLHPWGGGQEPSGVACNEVDSGAEAHASFVVPGPFLWGWDEPNGWKGQISKMVACGFAVATLPSPLESGEDA